MFGQTMKLWDGSTWNTSDPLPPQVLAALGRTQNPNQVPMGSPVGNMGTQAPSYAPAAPDAGQSAPMPMAGPSVASAPSLAPTGIFGQLPNATLPAKKPGFNDPGGLAEKLGMAGALLLSNAGNNAPIQMINQNRMDQRQAALQRMILDRQMALEAYKASNPDKTALQRNVEYFRSIGRDDLANAYLNSSANPLAAVQVTDPATGQVGLQFYPKGGMPGQSIPAPTPTTKTINGKTYYNVNGDWYDNPEGR